MTRMACIKCVTAYNYCEHLVNAGLHAIGRLALSIKFI